MKSSVIHNALTPYITNEQIAEVMDGLNDPFFGQTIPEDIEVSVTLWDVSFLQSGYGHWRVRVEMDINGVRKTFFHITTDSVAIDAANQSDNTNENGEKEAGYLSLFDECMRANEDAVYEIIEQQIEG